MASQLDLTAVLTADARVWVKETQRAAQSFNQLANTVQTQATRTQKRLDKLARFAKGALAAAIGFSLSRQIMKTAASMRRLGKEAVFGAARVEQMTSVLNMLGQGLGYSSREMDGFTEKIRGAGIEMGVAQKTLQEFIRYEMDLTQSTKLARVAQDAAVMSNSNSSETLQRLIYGISRQNSLILRNAGIQVMAGVAVDKHAASLNKSADQLTSNERTQAVLNAVLKEGTKIQGAYTKSLEEPIKKLGSLQRVWDDISGQIGDTLYPAFKVFINDIFDPYVKWLKKATAEGTRLNNFLSDFGLAAAAAFTEFAKFSQSDTFAKMSADVIGIADSFLNIFKSLRPLTTMLVNMQTFGAAVKVVATTLEALSKAVVPLAPLLQGLFTLKMIAAVRAMSSALVVDLRLRGMLAADTLRQAAAQNVATASMVAGTAATRGMAMAMAGVSSMMKKILPLLAAFAAFKAITGLISLFQERQTEAEVATKKLNATLYNQGRLVDDAGNAFKRYLDATSRFADRNQIDDLDELATKVGLTREMLVQLLNVPSMGGLDEFAKKMIELGGDNGLVAATHWQIANITTNLGGRSFEEAAVSLGYYVDAAGEVFAGNTDLITSFKAESVAVQAAAESNMKWLEMQGDQQSEWLREVLRTLGRAEGAFGKFDPVGVSIEDLFAIGLEKHKGDWVALRNFLETEMGKLEAEFLATEAAAKKEADRIEELNQKARKLSGSIAELTGDMREHWFSVVENNEAYKGFLERLGEVSERFEIFNSGIFNAMDASQAQEGITKSLTAILEENKDAVGGQGTAIKAVMNLIRTQAIPAATKFVKSQVDAADALGQTLDPAQLLNEALSITAANFTETAKQAGFLEEDIQNLINTMFGVDDVPIEVKFVTDLYGAFNIDTIKQAIGALAETIVGRSTEMFRNLTTILQGLEATPERLTSEMGRSLRGLADLEHLVTGHITDQMEAREKGLRAAIRYRRASKSIENIEESINDLLDERNGLNKVESRWNLERELSLARQNRNLIMLGETLKEITQRKHDIDLEGQGLDALIQKRDELLAQGSSVTTVESDLIGLVGKFTEEMAKQADVTAVEAAEIEDLNTELKAAIRQQEHGIISSVQLAAAHQKVSDAIEEALNPSEELVALTEEISQLERAQKTITEDLKIATIEHKLAVADKNAVVSREVAIAEGKRAIDEQLIQSGIQLAEATMEQAAAEVELAKHGPEVAAALEQMRDAGEKMGAVTSAAFDDMVTGLHNTMVAAQQAMPEFAFLKRLLDGIELAGLDAKQIDAFIQSIETALEEAEGILEGFDLIKEIEALLPDDWKDKLDGWRDDLQTAIDAWNLQATIDLILGDMPEIPGFSPGGGGGESAKPDAAGLIFGSAVPTDKANLAKLLAGELGMEAYNIFEDISAKTLTQGVDGMIGEFTAADALAMRQQATADYFAANVDHPDAGSALTAFLASLAPQAATGGYVKSGGLARIHAGETIVPANGGGMGNVYNINVGAGLSDPSAVSEAVVEALRAYERGNGPVPVTTTASMYTASA